MQGTLSRGTLWWLVRHGDKRHYKLHNEYSLQHAKLVKSSLQAEQHLVLSAATYTGSGAVGGSHAHGQADVACTWSNMKAALETALGLGLAGIPLAGGGSVCGTMGNYDEELCIRLVEQSTNKYKQGSQIDKTGLSQDLINSIQINLVTFHLTHGVSTH